MKCEHHKENEQKLKQVNQRNLVQIESLVNHQLDN